MKESNWLLSKIILVITLAMLCFTLSCQKQDVEADIAAIKEMGNQYAVACNTGDFDLWISLWTDDGIQMPPGAPARIGKEQILEAMKPTFDQMTLDIAITSIEDAKVYGDLGLTRCTYTLKMTPKAGGETIIVMPDGKALTFFERQSDGSWKIVYDCFNSNAPPKQVEGIIMQDTEAVRKIIDQHNANLVKWYASGDIDKVAEVFAEDCWQMPPHTEPMVGREALRAGWKQATQWGKWDFTLQAQDVAVNGQIAVERGKYTLKFSASPEAPHGLVSYEDKGNYVVFWRMESDKQWRIVWDAPVSDLPLPGSN